MDTALVGIDDRRNYNEERFVTLGLIGDRVHVMVFTVRGEAIRVISLRKANRREVKQYDDET
ncbi:BrnT family toxin [Pandoraea sp. SD6-2]|uniref:BrnT family toxin n=1 Tax=Pandoraea sp. SD6-2 TaxID=1286093 RepID=UPI003527AA5E